MVCKAAHLQDRQEQKIINMRCIELGFNIKRKRYIDSIHMYIQEAKDMNPEKNQLNPRS